MEPVYKYEGWTWVNVDVISEQEIAVLEDLSPEARSWAHSLHERRNSTLEMDASVRGEESMWGSVVYEQDAEVRNQKTILHYYISKNLLMTHGIDPGFFTAQHLHDYMEHADNAIEGFMVLLGEMTAEFLQRIERFEDRMHDLLWRVKAKNEEYVFELIMEYRHEILVWKNLIIPFMEIREAIKEAFGEKAAEGTCYQRTCWRIQRCRQTIREYDEEIGKLIDLESIISSHRGNEIVKTLTVITMLFTPVAAWGALWGMNFEIMPELKWKYGYIASLGIILLSTWGLYYYLKKKNWMGSVLKSPKDQKF